MHTHQRRLQGRPSQRGIAHVHEFIDWVARTSRKRKKKTYSDYWKLLCRCFSLVARRQMTGNVLEQMRRVQPTVLCSGIVVANRWPVHHTRLRADHSVGVRPKPKHTMSPQDLGVLLRQLWLYTRLAPLGRQLVQMAFVLLCCSFTGTRPRILVPPNSIATTLEDLEAGQEERQEARRFKLTISEHLCQPLICMRDLLQTSLGLSAKVPSSPSFQDFGMIRSMMGSRGSTEKLS